MAQNSSAEGKYLESQQQTDYERNIQAFIEEGCDLIVTVGFCWGTPPQQQLNLIKPSQSSTSRTIRRSTTCRLLFALTRLPSWPATPPPP